MNASDDKWKEAGGYFDADLADRATRFIESYSTPSTLGKRITLLPWQREFVSKLYGERLADGRRRYRKAVLSTAKKNGKTLLQSGILLYELLGGVTQSPFCVSASTTRENAGQIYRELTHSIQQNPRLKKLCKCLDSYKEIKAKDKSARYKAFSADAGAAEGENISALVVDELHAHKDNGRLFRALEYATVARPDGVSIIISTSGVDQSSLWFDLFKYAESVQVGDVIDTGLLAAIYTSDPDDDIDDPATWHKSNPSLGVSFSEDDFLRDLDRAKQEGTASLLSFRRYRLNQWCASEAAYLDPAKFDTCQDGINEAELLLAPLDCGVDLSQTTDPTSVGCCWSLPGRNYVIRSHSWVCEEGVRKRELTNLPKYRTYAAEGDMTITPGEVIDMRRVREYLLDLRNKYNLRSCTFDQYNCVELAKEVESWGVKVFKMPQTHKYFTSPMKEFEIAINEKRIRHNGNRLLRWAFSNARVDYDSNSGTRFDKDRSTDKIDPAVSVIMAFAYATTQAPQLTEEECVYNKQKVFTF